MIFKKVKAAFTIAELLMVLLVLGVIATITIGALWKNRPNDHIALFRKAYYVTEKTLYGIINRDEYYPYDVTRPGLLNTVQATDNGKKIEDAVGVTKLCNLFTREINVVGEVKCSVGSGSQGRAPLDINGGQGNGGNFKTTDGIVWSFPVADFSTSANERQIVEIDVNGPRGPNCNPRTCPNVNSKYDRFQIIILKNGTIAVDHEVERDYLSAAKKMTDY